MSLINALRRARPQVSQKSRQLRGCRGPARICVAMLSKQNQQLVALTVRYYPPGGCQILPTFSGETARTPFLCSLCETINV
jgi:hypothetical protein